MLQVNCTTPNTILAASYSGELLKTTNSGNSWNISNCPDGSYNTVEFDMVNSLNGYFYSVDDKNLYRTSDGGNSWNLVVSNHFLKELTFIDTNTGFAINENNQLIRTLDGGVTWQINTPAFNQKVSAYAMRNATQGTLTAGNKIYTTVDGGINWYLQWDNRGQNSTNFISTVALAGNNHGYILVNDAILGTKALLQANNNGGAGINIAFSQNKLTCPGLVKAYANYLYAKADSIQWYVQSKKIGHHLDSIELLMEKRFNEITCLAYRYGYPLEFNYTLEVTNIPEPFDFLHYNFNPTSNKICPGSPAYIYTDAYEYPLRIRSHQESNPGAWQLYNTGAPITTDPIHEPTRIYIELLHTCGIAFLIDSVDFDTLPQPLSNVSFYSNAPAITCTPGNWYTLTIPKPEIGITYEVIYNGNGAGHRYYSIGDTIRHDFGPINAPVNIEINATTNNACSVWLQQNQFIDFEDFLPFPYPDKINRPNGEPFHFNYSGNPLASIHWDFGPNATPGSSVELNVSPVIFNDNTNNTVIATLRSLKGCTDTITLFTGQYNPDNLPESWIVSLDTTNYNRKVMCAAPDGATYVTVPATHSEYTVPGSTAGAKPVLDKNLYSLLKYSAQGILQWTFSGPLAISKLQADNDGNVYVLFDRNPGKYLPSANSRWSYDNHEELVLAKYSASGALIWHATLRRCKFFPIPPVDMQLTRQNEIMLLLGNNETCLTWVDPDGIESAPIVATNNAVLKLDQNGKLLWANTLTQQLESIIYTESIAVDANGNTWMASNLLNGTTFIKLSNDGNLVFQLGGDETFSQFTDITTDPSNNVYMAGFFSGEVSFPGMPTLRTNNASSMFILKLNPQGNPIWIKQLDFIGAQNWQYNIVADKNSVYLQALMFKGKFSIDNVDITGFGKTNIALLKFNAFNGAFTGSIVQTDNPNLGEDQRYVCGEQGMVLHRNEKSLSVAAFNPSTIKYGALEHSIRGNYLARIATDWATVNTNPAPSIVADQSWTIYPNPASMEVVATSTNEMSEIPTVFITNASGSITTPIPVIPMHPGNYSFNMDTSKLPNGTYFIHWKNSTQNGTELLIIQH